LFAILADVRNGRGFAGVVTGLGFNVISKPKGLPSDVSSYVQNESDEWDCDGHSHSWLTLKEILDFDWNQVAVNFGTVSEEEYKKWNESGRKCPSSYCGRIDRMYVVTLSEAQYIEMCNKEGLIRREVGKRYYIAVSWTETYYECAGEGWWKVIEELKTLGNVEDVRLVFWFDN
jgi:hypothetical protein